MKKFTRVILGTACAAALAGSLTACSENDVASVPDSFFGYLVGNGEYHDNGPQGNRTVNRFLLPGTINEYNNNYDNAMYFPADKRNYIVAGEGGDTNQPLHGRTEVGTPVKLYVSVYWRPNLNTNGNGGDPLRESAAAQFIQFCAGKYQCSVGSPDDFGRQEGDVNSASDGWNKMLSENMWPVLNRVAERATPEVSDNVWIANDFAAKEAIAASMMDAFSAEMQKNTGATTDLFCGSGSTGVGDDFDCQTIRIVVDRVFAESDSMQQQSDQAAEDKRKIDITKAEAPNRIAVTDQQYGPLGPRVRACEDLHRQGIPATCVFGEADMKVGS